MTSTKCRAQNPAACTDPNCPEKVAAKSAFFNSVPSMQTTTQPKKRGWTSKDAADRERYEHDRKRAAAARMEEAKNEAKRSSLPIEFDKTSPRAADAELESKAQPQSMFDVTNPIGYTNPSSPFNPTFGL